MANSVRCLWIFGLVVIVPLIRTYTAKTGVGGTAGQTIADASIILGIMILPDHYRCD